MQTYKIYKNLAWLNELSMADAENAFRSCFASDEWARRMAAARPFAMLERLYETAAEILNALSPAQFLEALAAQDPISNDIDRADNLRADLNEALGLYQEKFGFIFVACISGNGSGELLAICRARLGNSAETELQIAVEEQRKITEIRLNKLLEQ